MSKAEFKKIVEICDENKFIISPNDPDFSFFITDRIFDSYHLRTIDIMIHEFKFETPVKEVVDKLEKYIKEKKGFNVFIETLKGE